MIGQILQGYATLFQPEVFFFLLVGFSIGLFFGLVPGLTATLAIALLLPITYVLEITNSLVMAMGIFMAGMYSGSITGIIVNIPGSPGGAITTLEGYPLMQKGEGAKALTHDAFSSFVGGTAGVILLMFLCPVIADLSLLLQSADKFSLIVLSLVAVSVSNRGNLAKGVIATTLGLMLATVGIDMQVAQARYTYGTVMLTEGIELLPAIIGIFAISELLIQIEKGKIGDTLRAGTSSIQIRRKDLIPKIEDIKKVGFRTYFKSTLIGTGIGALPGAGAAMAGFIAYAEARRSSKHPEEYGKGSIEGVSAVETANNAMCSGAMVPMLTLGIPGDAVTAMILGMFKIQGLVPGESLFRKSFQYVTPMYAALMVGAILIPFSIYFFGPYYLKIVRINRAVLYAFISMIAMVGAYAAEFSFFQMTIAFLMGVVTYLFRKLEYPTVPLLMGIILGPMAEDYLRRALMVSSGNPLIFLMRPASVLFLALSVVFFYFLGIRQRKTLMD